MDGRERGSRHCERRHVERGGNESAGRQQIMLFGKLLTFTPNGRKVTTSLSMKDKAQRLLSTINNDRPGGGPDKQQAVA